MKRLAKICKERGMVLIDDESMTGIGRTGKWFACDHYPVVPDILVTSKGIGGGVPLAACITSEEIGNGAIAKGHVQSAAHMGDPFQCAKGLANLRIMEEEGLLENATKMGELMRKGLCEISERCEALGDVRGAGLFIGLEFVEDRETKKPAYGLTQKLAPELHKRGILVGVLYGAKTNVLRLCPPLVIKESEVTLALSAIEESLAAVTSVSKA
jgi:4-aminobutyrate aminotransferase-like enzyme